MEMWWNLGGCDLPVPGWKSDRILVVGLPVLTWKCDGILVVDLSVLVWKCGGILAVDLPVLVWKCGGFLVAVVCKQVLYTRLEKRGTENYCFFFL